VKEALTLAKNHSATGMDGCPYELWKELDRMNEKAQEADSEGFDLTETLAIIFQDIQDHGIDERSDFALGWMCPIYKKKDKREISNISYAEAMEIDGTIIALDQEKVYDKIVRGKTSRASEAKRAVM
jgi:hypothetical protein